MIFWRLEWEDSIRENPHLQYRRLCLTSKSCKTFPVFLSKDFYRFQPNRLSVVWRRLPVLRIQPRSKLDFREPVSGRKDVFLLATGKQLHLEKISSSSAFEWNRSALDQWVCHFLFKKAKHFTVFSSDRKVLFQSIKNNTKPLLSNSFASVLKSKVLCKRGQVNR